MAKKPVKKVEVKAAIKPPAFPYTTTPSSLRKYLSLIPNKPQPVKVNFDSLKAWDLKNTNDQSIIRVLKALGLVGTNNEPTPRYVEFMSPENGPGVLAAAIKDVWAPLFVNSHEPHKEPDATLKNYFHIHSGGGDKAIQYQIQTFKAVCDHADFKTAVPGKAPGAVPLRGGGAAAGEGRGSGNPVIHIDLHIHLPENKTRRDYEYMFEDIARHIYGREQERSGDQS